MTFVFPEKYAASIAFMLKGVGGSSCSEPHRNYPTVSLVGLAAPDPPYKFAHLDHRKLLRPVTTWFW